MDSNRFFAEIVRRSAAQGISAGEIKNGCLPMIFSSNGSPICRVTEDGEVQYREENMDTPEKVEALHYITSVSYSASEYVQAMENAPPLKAVDSSDKYKLLLEHNGVVLAGIDMGPSNGYQFVTWRYTYDRSGVTLGHYYPNKYPEAKEEFAIRSGLIPEHRLFNKEQLLDIYRAVSHSMDERMDLTCKQEDALKEIKKQIERTVPSAEAILKAERQAKLIQAPGFTMGGKYMENVYALIRYQGNSLAVDFPLDIYDLPDHLGSIGITLSPGKVTVSDTADVSVKLTGLNEVGKAVVNKLSGSDSLIDINTLCHAIEEACPYGYDDMADRLEASDAKSAKELMQVIDEFIQVQQTQSMGGM
ncbi:MAG: hypothetical protein WCD89_05955 [Anaerocolumna sp.]